MSHLSNIAILLDSIFSRYKLSAEELEVMHENKTYWEKINNQKAGILVEKFLYSYASAIEKARITKSIEEKLNV